jgi:hypothetical protein
MHNLNTFIVKAAVAMVINYDRNTFIAMATVLQDINLSSYLGGRF